MREPARPGHGAYRDSRMRPPRTSRLPIKSVNVGRHGRFPVDAGKVDAGRDRWATGRLKCLGPQPPISGPSRVRRNTGPWQPIATPTWMA